MRRAAYSGTFCGVPWDVSRRIADLNGDYEADRL